MKLNSVEKNSIITGEDNVKYFVFNTVEFDNKHYAVCNEYENPKNVVVFEYRFVGEELQISREEDIEIVQTVLTNSLIEE